MQRLGEPLLLWIHSEYKFNELKTCIVSVVDNELKTTVGDTKYNFGSKKYIEQ